MPRLKKILEGLGRPQRSVADAIGISPAALSIIVTQGEWPRRDPEAVKSKLQAFLIDNGVRKAAVVAALNEKVKLGQPIKNNTMEETIMLMRKQVLSPQAKRQFGLPRSPFYDDLSGPDDIWLSADYRYVREAMLSTARHGGLLAVIGESGSGKSTLRKDLAHRIESESLPIIMIEPYVLAMEDNDQKGKTLKAIHLAESILYTVAPHAKCLSSPEARFRQVHTVLRDSSRAGYRHCMVIEEAHSLSHPTLKHLKRFMELEDGFNKLLSIILIGQTELQTKLGEADSSVREVVQRCEIIHIDPLGNDLPNYVAHKFQRVGVNMDKVIAPGALEALAARLTGPRSSSGQAVSLVYPLAVNNSLVAAINMAAHIGETKVTADVVNAI
jgi:type II secretory pathway predicted ATPase ExeA